MDLTDPRRPNTSLRRKNTGRRHPTAYRKNRNYGKVLPTLGLGVLITLLAMLFNYVIYDRRLPARATGNRILDIQALTDSGTVGYRNGSPVPPPMAILAGVINLSDDMIQDAMFAARGSGHLPPTKDKIAVIGIDENSLIRHGSWPWPRSDIATLMEKASDAKVIGLDMVFPEADRTSLSHYLERIKSLFDVELDSGKISENIDNDIILGKQISAIPTVLGVVLFDGLPPHHRPRHMKNNPLPEAALPNGGGAPLKDVLLKHAEYALTDIAGIRGVEPPPVGEGFINLFPTPAGVVRSIPVFAHVSEAAFAEADGLPRRVAPSLALEMMRASLGGDGYRIKLRGDTVNIPDFKNAASNGDRYPVAGVDILKDGVSLMTMPLTELAEMEISFRNHQDGFTVYPAWEVLEGKHDGAFKDKLVLIGGTVEGIGYVVSTGLPDPEVSVVQAHASMLSAMLRNDFIESSYQYDYFWQQIGILCAGLLVTLAIIFGDMLFGLLAAVAGIVGLALWNYFYFFNRGMDVGLTLPVLSTLAVLAVLMAANYLVVGRERRFIRKAFSLNVSPSILGYLESHPDRLSSLQGEHRNMTVLFSDIRGFTSMSERLSAPDLARFLNEYFTPMSDIVMRNMGTVDKFIGDGLMAFWNAPADNPEHPRDAARSALDMVAKLEELQPGWTSRGLPRIAIGCGINTGLMFAGYMGSEQRKNYTVMGDNVNIASRLENLNKIYTSNILITHSTREQLGSDFVCRVVDKVRVSGKESPVMIFELLGQGPASEEKIEELAAFARVFELYQQREFATAESLLKELVFIRPAPVYKLYLDRLAIYKALPPPEDWDGTFSMTAK